jgi:hypothetical protein
MKEMNNSYPRKSHEAQNINHNSFGSLSNEVECKNFGHMAKYCRLTIPPRETKKNIKHEPQRIWIRKHNQFNTEEYLLSLQV